MTTPSTVHLIVGGYPPGSPAAHDMDFVRQLEADITVLNEGRILAEGPMSVVQADPRVIEAYLGR